jgi:hypothetical protein
MTALLKVMTFALFAWILWMDQTVYDLSRTKPSSGGAEGTSSRWAQLAVVADKATCEALRRDQIAAALRRQAAQPRGGYPEHARYFCSPAVEDPHR